MEIQQARKNEARKILYLRYLAFQSVARLFENPNIPHLRRTIEEVEIKYEKCVFLKAVANDVAIIRSASAFTENKTSRIGKFMASKDIQGQ